ncbi:hypothetical protein NKI89_29180 [Mesorhizobium sp. M0309]|uniref:hypothetical protein n=1 Tax=Mesorhizobium sp. M0309 TaxID=2956933 RepID=UPI003335B118
MSTSGLFAARGAKFPPASSRLERASTASISTSSSRKSVRLVRVFSKAVAGIVGIEFGAGPPRARPVAALPFAAAQRQNANARLRPVGFVAKNPAAGAQHGMGRG